MKNLPCSNRQKPIVLLALDELDAPAARELRAHLHACEGCRRYFGEMSVLTSQLSAGQTAAGIETSESFHRKVVARLRAEEKPSLWHAIQALLAMMDLRVALPVMAVSLALAVGLTMRHRQPGVWVAPAGPPHPVVSTPDADAGLAPTLANYQAAVNQSMQAFDHLLNEQAGTPLPPAPVYTLSMLTLADLPE